MKKIEEKIEENKLKILKLLNLNIDLNYQSALQKATRFETKEVNLGTKRKPKIKLVKFMFYNEIFKDEDGGESISVERKQPIEVDGQKSNHFRIIEYYTIKDL